MGRNKAIVILGIGALIALIASVFTYGWLQRKGRVQAQTVETISVVVASSDLTWGTVLSTDKVKLAPFLRQSLPEGYFADVKKVVDRTLIHPVKMNEPIFDSRLAPTGTQGGGVAAVISPKKRAMAVKVDKVVGVSGFIHPGNRVDVLVTLSQTGTGRVATPITKTVLENVLVLATGAEMEKAGNREKPSQVDVITLEVGVEEGEKLALAASEGKLQLALRNSADTGNVDTKGTTFPVLLGSYSGHAQASMEEQPVRPRKQVVRKQAAAAPALRTAVSVELVKGGTVSSVNFNKGE